MDIKSYILFEDDELVIVNKPGGLLSIPDGYDQDLPCVKRSLDNLYGRVWTVHRLDKHTSGILVFAKNQPAHRDLNIQFTNHQITKEYIACTHGFPLWKQKTVSIPLRINADRRHRTLPDLKNGKKAITSFTVIKRSEQACMMMVSPKTGLTHQIRAHTACLGLPIIGDSLYWRLGSIYEKNTYSYPFSWDKLYLHASSITFKHPANGKMIAFNSPLPEYFQEMP